MRRAPPRISSSMPTCPVRRVADTTPAMKAPSWALRRSPQSDADRCGQLVGGDDAGEDGVLPVVADVSDPVGPADDLALGGGRRRAGPAVVGDAVDRLGAQVERGQGHVRPPGRVVETAGHVGVQRVLAGVPARPVAAVVAEGDGLGEVHVEAAGPCDRRGHLCHLEGMGQACALVVLGEHEDLRLSRQATERAWHGGCGRGHARSTCATDRAPRARAGCRRPTGGWRRAPAASPRAPGAPPCRSAPRAARSASADPGAGPTRAWESAWARRTGPEYPAIVAAQRALRSDARGLGRAAHVLQSARSL